VYEQRNRGGKAANRRRHNRRRHNRRRHNRGPNRS
jgi:hypothetical protein